MNREAVRTLLGLVVLLGVGCRPLQVPAVTPSATARPVPREAAIATAQFAARESEPKIDMLDSRIDSIAAEFYPTAVDAWRVLGQDGSIAGDGPVWLVRVYGLFRYKGMTVLDGPAAIEETHERDFLISARTGEVVGSHLSPARAR